MQRTECNEQGSKVDDFFKQVKELHEEMVCQKDLRGERILAIESTQYNQMAVQH